jgi:hypothetical protein
MAAGARGEARRPAALGVGSGRRRRCARVHVVGLVGCYWAL